MSGSDHRIQGSPSCLFRRIASWMCGILFQLCGGGSQEDIDDLLLSRVSCRGPDSIKTITRSTPDHQLSFTSSVLHLRGNEVVTQPVVDPFGNVLSWNGEAWSGLDIAETENDTSALSQTLARESSGIPEVFERLRGPYAFIYYQVRRLDVPDRGPSLLTRWKRARYGTHEIS